MDVQLKALVAHLDHSEKGLCQDAHRDGLVHSEDLREAREDVVPDLLILYVLNQSKGQELVEHWSLGVAPEGELV